MILPATDVAEAIYAIYEDLRTKNYWKVVLVDLHKENMRITIWSQKLFFGAKIVEIVAYISVGMFNNFIITDVLMPRKRSQGVWS